MLRTRGLCGLASIGLLGCNQVLGIRDLTGASDAAGQPADGPAADARAPDARPIPDGRPDATPDASCFATWLEGWGYRQSFVVSNGGADVTNLQLQLVVNTSILVSHNKLSATGDDLRVTLADGVTLVPYVIESGMNTTQTSVWVKLADLPAGSTTLYLYYGNPAAAPASDGAKVWVQNVIANPTFQDASAWNVTDDPHSCSGFWNLGSGDAFVQISRPSADANGCWWAISQALVLPPGDYVVRFDWTQVMDTNKGPTSLFYICNDGACGASASILFQELYGDFTPNVVYTRETNFSGRTLSGTPTLIFQPQLGSDSGQGGWISGHLQNLRLRKSVSPAPTATAQVDEIPSPCT